MRFRDRADAGRRLAEQLGDRQFRDPIVLALPRGGVPVGFEVASRLNAPLAVFVARKIGAPDQPEFGIGAVAEDGAPIVDEAATRTLSVGAVQFEAMVQRERIELARRVEQYRHGQQLPPLSGRDVLLVDDGLATGVTAEAALRALRGRKPRQLILAVPVCAPQAARRLRDLADDVVCVLAPPSLGAVGAWYDDFDQTTDAEVLELLRRPRRNGQTSGTFDSGTPASPRSGSMS